MKKTMTDIPITTKKIKGKAMFPSRVGIPQAILGNSARVGKLPTMKTISLDTKATTEVTL